MWEKLGVKYPIIQAGMVWVSGGKLAAAAANAGALGTIGAGSLKPPMLDRHIKKAQSLAPGKPIAVNIPLLYQGVDEQIETCLENGIKIFSLSAGSPKLFTKKLKDQGAFVMHVTSTPLLAKKCEDAGVDAVIVEGFEAGGHNGRDEITTLTLIPQVIKAVRIPVIAAGGIGNGGGIAAVMALGAVGAQVGSRFAATQESSAHNNFKEAICKSSFSDTQLCMKSHVPVRLMKNEFYNQVKELESKCASKEELVALLGKGRAKKGMLEGNLTEGELEIGQVSGLIDDLPTCQQLVNRLIEEYRLAKSSLPEI